MTRNRITLVLLAILSAVLALLGYQHLEQRAQEEAQRAARESHRQRAEQIRRDQQAERELAEKLAHRDVDMENRVPKAYSRPVSAWRTAEKAFYEGVLTKGRFDVLVVPFQVQDHAFGREIRSLMTARLVTRMAAGADGKASIPDPYVVGRVLGDGERRYDLMEVFRVANALKVTRVVLGYAGHNAKDEMRLTLHYYDRTPNELFGAAHAPRPGKSGQIIAFPRLQSRHFEKLAYGDADTPIEIFERALPDMLKFLGVDPSAANAAKAVSQVDTATLPASPLEMFSGVAHPARDAYHFQLLAALAPSSSERTRERLNEKSMLATLDMSPDSPDYRALKARALMNMGLRPAALHALGTPTSAEERHLVAMLNGNLPEVRTARALIPAGVRAAIAALEENAMAAVYGARTQKSSLSEVAALKLPGEVWPFLVARAMTDWDDWTQHENIYVKVLLDREFPIAGFTAQSMLHGASAIGDPSKLQTSVELSVLDHVRKHVDANWCCEPLTARPGTLDYLDLIEGIATDNLARRASFLARIQGRPEDALQFLARLESTYRDHPQFALARAQAQMALAKTAQGAEREGLLRAAYTAGFNVWYWEQGQTLTAQDAFDVVGGSGRRDFGTFDNFYVDDYPFRPFYSGWQLPGAMEVALRNYRRALQNSTFNIQPVAGLEWSLGQGMERWDEVDQLLKSIEHRFVGHPKRVQLMAQSSLRKGNTQAAESHYREGIRAQPNDQKLYVELGNLLFKSGAIERSMAVFMSYPGLKSSSGINPVGLANYAYKAGSLYYWSGELEQAIPLYRTSADLNTGSEASIASRTRLHLIDGDYVGALSGSLERARRYDSAHAYRDYFGLLHAMGHSKEAWDGFRNLVQRDEPQVWETALVGHRRERASEAQIAGWLAQEPMKSAGVKHPYAALYMARAGVTDRTPTDQLPSLITDIERPVWKVGEERHVQVVRQSRAGIDHLALGPDSPDSATLPRGVFETAKKTRVKSDYVYLAQAYRALRTGNFAAARLVLQEAAALYDMRNPSLGYLLPYYAYAAARSGETTSVEALLDKFAEPYRGFDYHLAKAALHGVAGKHREAMQHIRLARYRRPFTENRPVYTEYQFAELCEWLFDATGRPSYRAMALGWAQKNQVVQPWFAWAYAIEARLSTDAAARRRAIAMTHYLDPRSVRLSRLPRSEVDAAVKEFAGRNPFLQPAAFKRKERA